MTLSVFVSKLSGMPGAIHSQFYLAMRNAENIQTIEYSVHQTQFSTNFLAFNTQLRLYLNYISSCRLSWIVIGYITLSSTIRIQVFNPHIFAYWFSRWLSQWFILLYVGSWWNKTEINLPCRTEWQIIESVLSYLWSWSLSAKSIWTNMTRSFSWFFALRYRIVFIVTITLFQWILVNKKAIYNKQHWNGNKIGRSKMKLRLV